MQSRTDRDFYRVSPNAAFEPYKQVVTQSPAGLDAPSESPASTQTKAVVTTELVPPMIVFVVCQVAV